MNLLSDFVRSGTDGEALKQRLFEFLAGDDLGLSLTNEVTIGREEAERLLQELIPAKVEVRGVCSRKIPVVIAAPHVSFDNWSEYFCNRAAKELRTGWVVAVNYRDEDRYSIPVSIGRHIHVNRPTESARRRGREQVTDRAESAYREYVQALQIASGGAALPLPLLVEFHSQHRTSKLEVATTGMGREVARWLWQEYEAQRESSPLIPELLIEPLHDLKLKAESTKSLGVLRPDVTRVGLHVEIPKTSRHDEISRAELNRALIIVLDALVGRMENQK